MTREQAHEILMKYMKGENYITHSYAVEAIMRISYSFIVLTYPQLLSFPPAQRQLDHQG